MTEAAFWELVNSVAGPTDVEPVVAMLCQLPQAELASFNAHLHAIRARAATPELLIANYIIRGQVSESPFEEFRTWLIFQGQDRFERALADADSIAEWSEPEPIEESIAEELLLAPMEVYCSRGSDIEAFCDAYVDDPAFTQDPSFEVDWPESAEEFQARFPKLFAKYWKNPISWLDMPEDK